MAMFSSDCCKQQQTLELRNAESRSALITYVEPIRRHVSVCFDQIATLRRIVGLKMEMNDKFRAKPSSWKNPALYKSRLCDAWINGRECRFGVHCWFAHGPHELRSLPYLGDNPTAKTISLAQVIQTLPQLSRGRKYAQTANLAFATEFVKSVAPVLNQNMRLSESQNPFTASKHSTPSFNHSMPRNPNPSAVSTFTFSRSNPFAAGL